METVTARPRAGEVIMRQELRGRKVRLQASVSQQMVQTLTEPHKPQINTGLLSSYPPLYLSAQAALWNTNGGTIGHEQEPPCVFRQDTEKKSFWC